MYCETSVGEIPIRSSGPGRTANSTLAVAACSGRGAVEMSVTAYLAPGTGGGYAGDAYVWGVGIRYTLLALLSGFLAVLRQVGRCRSGTVATRRMTIPTL